MRVRAALVTIVMAGLVAGCGGSTASPSASTSPASQAPASVAALPSVVPSEAPPTPEITPAPPATGTVYVVKKGDTLYGIAAKFHVSPAKTAAWVDAVVKANPIIKNRDVLQVGWKLTIP